MKTIAVVLTGGFVLVVLVASIAVNAYYFASVQSVNSRIEAVAGPGYRDDGLDPLGVQRLQKDVNALVQNQDGLVKRNQDLERTITQVRTELSNARSQGPQGLWEIIGSLLPMLGY